MSEVPSTVGTGQAKLFLRNATGLVREVSLSDAFIMNTFGMNIAVGAVFLFLQGPAFFPNGNMLLAVIIGTLLMAFTLLWVYSTFAAAMPRSGGDYVYVSRSLHPFLGWLLGWSQGMWLIFFWIGFNAWFALTFAVPVALSTIVAVLFGLMPALRAGRANAASGLRDGLRVTGRDRVRSTFVGFRIALAPTLPEIKDDKPNRK